jgi:hypothetical protein
MVMVDPPFFLVITYFLLVCVPIMAKQKITSNERLLEFEALKIKMRERAAAPGGITVPLSALEYNAVMANQQDDFLRKYPEGTTAETLYWGKTGEDGERK